MFNKDKDTITYIYNMSFICSVWLICLIKYIYMYQTITFMAYLYQLSKIITHHIYQGRIQEEIWFFGVKSWFFTRNTSNIFAPPSAIGKNMIFWRKIVIFHTKYPNNFRTSLRTSLRTIVIRKRTKGQTTIYKTLHIQLKIE